LAPFPGSHHDRLGSVACEPLTYRARARTTNGKRKNRTWTSSLHRDAAVGTVQLAVTRGHAKARIALRDGLPVSPRLVLAEFTVAGRPCGVAKVPAVPAALDPVCAMTGR
jgi:hypothetical protein